MSTALWCNIGDHAFNQDAGVVSLSSASRVPDRTHPSGFRVVQSSGDACIPCHDRQQEFRNGLAAKVRELEAKSSTEEEGRVACSRKGCTRWALPGKKLCQPHRDDFVGARV